MTSPRPELRALIVMGVSGSGKTTVAELLAGRLGWRFLEGDELHSAANVAKMRSGRPLTDADRLPWLERVAARIDAELASGRSAVITCSALKRRYRDLLRRDGVGFVYLRGTRELIAGWLSQRHGHFMPSSLLDTQLADLQPPGPDERVITIDIGDPPEKLVARIIAALPDSALAR